MNNLLIALVPTFIVWLITVLTQQISLTMFQLFLIYCISYLVTKEVKYDMGEK
jgi:hypothetical protein